MSAKITPLASQTSFEKQLLIVYCVFFVLKPEKVVSLGKFDDIVELALGTQPMAKRL